MSKNQNIGLPERAADAMLLRLLQPGGGGDMRMAQIACDLDPEMIDRVRMNRPDLAALATKPLSTNWSMGASSPFAMSKVVQLPKGKQAPKANGYRVIAKGSDAAEIYIYGVIGGDWFGEGITAKMVADDLKALGKVKSIDVRINSEGGDVFQGKAIYSLLVENKATVNVKIDGLAASAASFIACAGNSIEIAEGAFVMIHDAYGVSFGRAEDMRTYADLLDTVNASIVDVYVARTKQPPEKIKKWMKDETWMTAKEAVANGFADTMTDNLKVAASVTHPDRFKKVPGALLPRRAAAAAKLAALTL